MQIILSFLLCDHCGVNENVYRFFYCILEGWDNDWCRGEYRIIKDLLYLNYLYLIVFNGHCWILKTFSYSSFTIKLLY